MRISVNTPDRLVVTHRPVTLSVVLGATLFFQLWVVLVLGRDVNWF